MIPDAVEAELAAVLADLPAGLSPQRQAAMLRAVLEADGWEIHPGAADAPQEGSDGPPHPEGRPGPDRPAHGHQGTPAPPPRTAPLTPKPRATADDARAIAARYDRGWPIKETKH